ncbi:MAG: hypothetical protein Q8P28_09685 [Deltaproteobacteria bacterium]|nr:hypothetical protein [Deltaproteobacteria bacterium]
MSRKTLGLSDIKTGQRAKIRSMLGRKGKDYLGLFGMAMEKTRLEHEMQTIDKRKMNIEAEIKDLKREIEKMEQSAPAQFKHEKKNKLRRNAGAKSPLKAMVMDY